VVDGSDGWLLLLAVAAIGFTILYFVVKVAVVNGMREVIRLIGTDEGSRVQARSRRHFDGVIARIKRHDETGG
jgi:hypothetical protein